MGIPVAIPIVATGRPDVIALPEHPQFGKYLGLAVLALVAWLLYRTGAKANPERLIHPRPRMPRALHSHTSFRITDIAMNLRLAILPLALALSLPSVADAARGFAVRDMAYLDRHSSPTLSPDGRVLVFAKRVVDKDSNKSSTSLWIPQPGHARHAPRRRG